MMKKQFILFAAMMTMLPVLVFGQRPSSVPYDSEPVGFFDSTANVIIYIVLPLLIVLIYILWRRKIKKEEQDNAE